MTTEPVVPRRRATRVGEVVGLAAVVGSLLFVGLQVRQAAQATRGATQIELGGVRGYWSQEPTKFNAAFRVLVDSIIAAQ